MGGGFKLKGGQRTRSNKGLCAGIGVLFISSFIVCPLSPSFRICTGRPDPVTNCSVLNMTFDMVFIECAEGFNGGLVQAFRADVFSSDFRHHVQTVRSR